MNTYNREKNLSDTSRWRSIMLALISAILGSGTLWFIWIRYESLRSQPDFYWFNWIQLAGFALLGALCLWASILFVSGKSSGWSVFKAGLSIIPLILFFNLMILVYRGIQNIIRGNAYFFFERVLNQPHKVIIILVVVIALTVLGSLTEKKREQ
jgi:hypothetical protein